MNYVALLRGINVGGNSRVEMDRLKRVFEAIGCTNVSTYINSGNVMFVDSREISVLTPIIEAAILSEFGFHVPTLLRDQANIAQLCRDVPEQWTNDTFQRTDVMFLWDKYDEPNAVDQVIHDPSFEHIRYLDGALVWNIERQYVKRGAVVRLLQSDFYKHMTIRNINTVRKLNGLLAQLPS